MKSPLRILGFAEGLVVMGIGVFLTQSLSSTNGPFGWAIVGLGILTVILAGFLGGQGPQVAEDPQETSEPETAKPPLALASSAIDIQSLSDTIDERWVSHELDRWRWCHRSIRVRQQALRLEQYAREHDNVLPWLNQRISELFLLAEGYAHKAGVPSDASHTPELAWKGSALVSERMQILEQEAEKLRQDAQLYVAGLQEWPEDVRGMDYAEELERIRDRLEDLKILREQYGRLNERDVMQNAP